MAGHILSTTYKPINIIFKSFFFSRFPVNPDVVTAHNFDAVLAKKYFIVCVPTVYGKLFPRLLCCPDHEFFDPFHLDGCVHEHYLYPTPLPRTLPPPIFGNLEPSITYIDAFLEPGSFGGFRQ
jgi:hypothetical protein